MRVMTHGLAINEIRLLYYNTVCGYFRLYSSCITFNTGTGTQLLRLAVFDRKRRYPGLRFVSDEEVDLKVIYIIYSA